MNSKQAKLELFQDRLLVLPIEEEVASGLIIPDDVRKSLSNTPFLGRGKVINIGPDVKSVSVGDIVYVFLNRVESDFIIDGKTYAIFREQSLMGKEIAIVNVELN